MSVSEIGRLADLLIRRYGTPDVNGSALFPFTRVDVDEDELDALLIPLRQHPADHLRRFRPPVGCIALGLVSTGWAAPIDSPVRPSAHPDAQRVHHAVVLGRNGALHARMRRPDGTVLDMGSGGYGRVPDGLRSAMRRAA